MNFLRTLQRSALKVSILNRQVGIQGKVGYETDFLSSFLPIVLLSLARLVLVKYGLHMAFRLSLCSQCEVASLPSIHMFGSHPIWMCKNCGICECECVRLSTQRTVLYRLTHTTVLCGEKYSVPLSFSSLFQAECHLGHITVAYMTALLHQLYHATGILFRDFDFTPRHDALLKRGALQCLMLHF